MFVIISEENGFVNYPRRLTELISTDDFVRKCGLATSVLD